MVLLSSFGTMNRHEFEASNLIRIPEAALGLKF